MTIRRSIKNSILGVLLALALVSSFGRLQAQAPKGDDGRQTTPAGNSAAVDATEKDENEVYKHSAVVKKMAGMMGISTDVASTTFEFFNFAVLAIALGVLAIKLVPKALRDRSSAIQKDLADARSATEEASARLNSVEERLSKLDAQIAEMRAQDGKDAIGEEQRFKVLAEVEKQKILTSAEQEIASATLQARRDLQQFAASLAIEQAARRLVISAETDRLLVKNFAQRLGEGSKGGEN